MDSKAFGEELAAIVKGAIAEAVPPLKAEVERLEKRLKAVEAEIRAGHKRLTELEAKHD